MLAHKPQLGEIEMREVGKRVLDSVLTIPALLLLAPLLGIIALLIRLDSPGPALFRQARVGRDGNLFSCLKFRTMRHNADQTVHRLAYQRMAAGGVMSHDSSAPYKLMNDDRITRIGKFLRQTSLDELPQLFNVLSGDMSLVGPRPAIPYELENYQDWQHRRHEVRPGITGLWQVYGRGTVGFEGQMRMDVTYAVGWTLWLDIKLIALTLPVMLLQRGAR